MHPVRCALVVVSVVLAAAVASPARAQRPELRIPPSPYWLVLPRPHAPAPGGTGPGTGPRAALRKVEWWALDPGRVGPFAKVAALANLGPASKRAVRANFVTIAGRIDDQKALLTAYRDHPENFKPPAKVDERASREQLAQRSRFFKLVYQTDDLYQAVRTGVTVESVRRDPKGAADLALKLEALRPLLAEVARREHEYSRKEDYSRIGNNFWLDAPIRNTGPVLDFAENLRGIEDRLRRQHAPSE